MMNKSMRLESSVLSVAIASLFAVSLPVIAQDAEKSGDWGKPSGIPWGPVVAYPEVDLTFKRNDNIYSQPSTVARKSSNITVLAPKLKLEAKTGPHTFDASYRVERGWFSGASVENYTDHVLNANAQWVFSGRSGLKLSAAYQKMHEDRGSDPGIAVGTHSAPDEYTQSSVNGKLGYGAEGAQGRVELDAGFVGKRYDNFRSSATTGLADNSKRDRDDSTIGATFFWRIAPKTQLLFQATQSKFDYTLSDASFVAAGDVTRDNTERSYLVGVTWEAAAKTTGIFKVGSVKKDFSSSTRRDFSGGSWDATVKWSPLTYSTFDFNTGQAASEGTIGNAGLDSKYGVAWNHVWNSRLSSIASYNQMQSDYQNNAGTGQTDKTNTLGLKLNYQWMRTVKIGAGYDRTDKTSDKRITDTSHKKNIYSVFLNAAI